MPKRWRDRHTLRMRSPLDVTSVGSPPIADTFPQSISVCFGRTETLTRSALRVSFASEAAAAVRVSGGRNTRFAVITAPSRGACLRPEQTLVFAAESAVDGAADTRHGFELQILSLNRATRKSHVHLSGI